MSTKNSLPSERKTGTAVRKKKTDKTRRNKRKADGKGKRIGRKEVERARETEEDRMKERKREHLCGKETRREAEGRKKKR